MTALATGVERLLALGADGRHPAGAVLAAGGPDGAEAAAAGWATLPGEGSAGVPMAPDTWLDWASVTKVAATTTLAMVLVARAGLSLEDPVHRHVPAFTGDGRDAVTVRDLLTHTSGLEPWFPLYTLTTDRDEALAAVVRRPLAGAPGSTRRYSDLGMALAGLVVERVTGLHLATAFDALVAAPLGLSLRYGPVPPGDAATSADSDVVELTMVATDRPHPVAAEPAAFTGWRAGPVRGEVHDGNAAHAFGGVAGHAGLFGPATDLVTLGTALLDGRLVDPGILAVFAEPSRVDPTQAVGFRRLERPGADGEPTTWLCHNGFTGTVWALDLVGGAVVAGGATRLHGTTGPLPARWPGPDAPDPLAGVATGEQVAEVALCAVTPVPALEEPSR